MRLFFFCFFISLSCCIITIANTIISFVPSPIACFVASIYYALVVDDDAVSTLLLLINKQWRKRKQGSLALDAGCAKDEVVFECLRVIEDKMIQDPDGLTFGG